MNVSESITLDRIITITKNKSLSKVLWVSAFTILTAIGAQVSIPTFPVPITLQTFFVLLAGAMLGSRNGAASQIAYLTAGAIGLPVFANGGGSFLHLIGPTGGYLLGFPVAAFLIGYLIHDVASIRNLPVLVRTFVAMIAGLLVIFLLGVLQLSATVLHNFSAAFQAGFVSLQWWDGLKLLAAASIYAEVARRYSKVG